MTGDKKNIDYLFRQSLKGFREKPPVQSWSKLNRALDGAAYGKKMFFYRLIAASVLILMAFGAGYFYAVNFHTPVNMAEKGILIDPGPAEIITVPEQEDKTVSDIDNLIIESEPFKEEDNNIDQSIDFNESLLLANEENKSVPGFSEPLSTVDVFGKDEGNAKPTIHRTEKSSNTLLGLAFIDLDQLKLPESSLDEKKNLFATKSSTDLFIGYQGIAPYDFENKTVTKDKSLAMGAQFAPTYSYREISANYGTNLGGEQDNFNGAEDPLRSYAGGVNVDYNFSGRWSVESGMYFSRIGQVNNDALQFEQKNNEFLLYAINTSTGNIDIVIDQVPDDVKKVTSPKDTMDLSGIGNVKIVQNFDLFEVPLLIKYKVLDRKFSIHFSGGLSPAYLVDNSTYLEYEDQKYDVGDAGNLNSMIVNTSLGLGLEYLITRKLSVNFEPTFKYALNPINTGSNFNYHPYYISWFTGVRLKIN